MYHLEREKKGGGDLKESEVPWPTHRTQTVNIHCSQKNHEVTTYTGLRYQISNNLQNKKYFGVCARISVQNRRLLNSHAIYILLHELTAPTWAYRSNYLLLLSYSMSSGLSLQVILRIPVWIKNDNCISRSQVYAQATSSGREEEAKVLSSEKRLWLDILMACLFTIWTP